MIRPVSRYSHAICATNHILYKEKTMKRGIDLQVLKSTFEKLIDLGFGECIAAKSSMDVLHPCGGYGHCYLDQDGPRILGFRATGNIEANNENREHSGIMFWAEAGLAVSKCYERLLEREKRNNRYERKSELIQRTMRKDPNRARKWIPFVSVMTQSFIEKFLEKGEIVNVSFSVVDEICTRINRGG